MAGQSEAFEDPVTASAVDGQVVILGPGAIAATLTPEAAEESARRLMEAARQARANPRP